MTSKSAALKRLQGNPGKRPIEDGPVVVHLPALTEIPEPHGELSPSARAVFDSVAQAMIDAEILTVLDLTMLTAYARAYDAYVKASAAYEAEPQVPGQRGLIRNPAQALARDSLAVATMLGKQLGLTPVSRKGLTSAAPVERALSAAPDLEAVLG